MILNTILFFALILICFSLVFIAKQFFGKAGLYAWIAIAAIVSNITAASVGPMLGLPGVTLANVPFATIFLCTDILAVCYGYKESKKGVYIGLFASISFLSTMMLCSYLIPEPYDSVTKSINYLFSFGSYNMCNTVASVLMFFLANLLDVWLFDKLNKKLKGKKLWISNNIATMISNCLENFAFVTLGLYVFPNIIYSLIPGSIDPMNLMLFSDCMIVAITTCVFEVIIALLDTPVLYLVKYLHNKSKKDLNNK